MVVRAKIRLRTLKGEKGRTIEGAALLNAGYESKDPEVIIPKKLAEKLGLWPLLPDGTAIETYKLAANKEVQAHYIKNCLESQVVTEDTVSSIVKTAAVIMEEEREILLSDASISAYQIVLEDAKAGIWRFKNEEKLRESEKTEYW